MVVSPDLLLCKSTTRSRSPLRPVGNRSRAHPPSGTPADYALPRLRPARTRGLHRQRAPESIGVRRAGPTGSSLNDARRAALRTRPESCSVRRHSADFQRLPIMALRVDEAARLHPARVRVRATPATIEIQLCLIARTGTPCLQLDHQQRAIAACVTRQSMTAAHDDARIGPIDGGDRHLERRGCRSRAHPRSSRLRAKPLEGDRRARAHVADVDRRRRALPGGAAACHALERRIGAGHGARHAPRTAGAPGGRRAARARPPSAASAVAGSSASCRRGRHARPRRRAPPARGRPAARPARRVSVALRRGPPSARATTARSRSDGPYAQRVSA